jgi:hypothetical protein
VRKQEQTAASSCNQEQRAATAAIEFVDDEVVEQAVHED